MFFRVNSCVLWCSSCKIIIFLCALQCGITTGWSFLPLVWVFYYLRLYSFRGKSATLLKAFRFLRKMLHLGFIILILNVGSIEFAEDIKLAKSKKRKKKKKKGLMIVQKSELWAIMQERIY